MGVNVKNRVDLLDGFTEKEVKVDMFTWERMVDKLVVEAEILYDQVESESTADRDQFLEDYRETVRFIHAVQTQVGFEWYDLNEFRDWEVV